MEENNHFHPLAHSPFGTRKESTSEAIFLESNHTSPPSNSIRDQSLHSEGIEALSGADSSSVPRTSIHSIPTDNQSVMSSNSLSGFVPCTANLKVPAFFMASPLHEMGSSSDSVMMTATDSEMTKETTSSSIGIDYGSTHASTVFSAQFTEPGSLSSSPAHAPATASSHAFQPAEPHLNQLNASNFYPQRHIRSYGSNPTIAKAPSQVDHHPDEEALLSIALSTDSQMMLMDDVPTAPLSSSTEESQPCDHSDDKNGGRFCKCPSGRKDDPWGPYMIQARVASVVSKWIALKAIHPDMFLTKMLGSRGYDASLIRPPAVRRAPSQQQVCDYDTEFVNAVRTSDLPKIKDLCKAGRLMSACNLYSESIVHIACRRANLDVVDFVLGHGGDIGIVDDFGRTPLHDACWRPSPQFDIITLLLDKNLDLIRTVDIRGSSPLSYVRKENWIDWCAFLFHQREKYWRSLHAVDHSISLLTAS